MLPIIIDVMIINSINDINSNLSVSLSALHPVVLAPLLSLPSPDYMIQINVSVHVSSLSGRVRQKVEMVIWSTEGPLLGIESEEEN